MLSGTYEKRFAPLARAFESVLNEGKHGGASLCVYQDGQKVLDLWGGVRDGTGAPWEERTPCVAFSTTKGVVSTALHMLVDRGLLRYDDPVARYWPEFAQGGKGALTVRELLSHRAGLYDVRSLLTFEELLDWERSVDVLARAAPRPVPRHPHAYHAMTFGHLAGELVQRVAKRPLSEFVRSEIAEPLGLRDFWLGASEEGIARAARLVRKPRRVEHSPDAAERMRQQRRTKRRRRMKLVEAGLKLFGLPVDFARVKSAFWPRNVELWDLSSPEVLRAVSPSFNGLFTARDLARMYAALSLGGRLDGVRLLSEDTLRAATLIHARGPDGVLVFPMGWRLGYHSVPSLRGVVGGAFGHFGYGGSGAWASPRHRLSLGFVVNVGSGTPVGDLRIVKLSTVALRCAG